MLTMAVKGDMKSSARDSSRGRTTMKWYGWSLMVRVKFTICLRSEVTVKAPAPRNTCGSRSATSV